MDDYIPCGFPAFMQLLPCAQTKLTCTHGRLIIHTVDLWRKKTGESKQQWSQPMREVCATRKACPCHGGKSQSAHWRSTRCASAAAKRTIQKKPLGAWWRVGCSQDTLPNPSHCLSTFLSVCLFSQPVGGFFQLKAEAGKPPPMMLHFHPSLIQFALICREPHLSLRAGGVGWGVSQHIVSV